MRSSPSNHILDRIAITVVVLVPLGVVGFYAWQYVQPTPAAAPIVQSVIGTPVSSPPSPVSLSVNDPRSLPQQVAAGALAQFAFVLQNDGTQDSTYQYKVSVKWSSGGEDVIDENSLSVAAGKSAVVNESLKFEQAHETASVTVQVLDPAQVLTFTIPRTN